jgi:hypothetical protein
MSHSKLALNPLGTIVHLIMRDFLMEDAFDRARGGLIGLLWFD